MNKTEKATRIAKERYADALKRGDSAAGGDALAYLDDILTTGERAESDLRVSLINELINARQEQGISQKKLEAMSGVKQPVIARMESGQTSPQIGTVLKVLEPLGKTLAVVPIDAK